MGEGLDAGARSVGVFFRLRRRPPEADNSPTMPQVHKPEVVKGVLVKQGAPRSGPRPGRAMQPRTAPTYKLVLLREDTGQIMHQWSQIPHDRVGPLLETMRTYLPWFVRASAAKEAIEKLMSLFK